MKLSIVIPCYNEAEAIDLFFPKLHKVQEDLIHCQVVDECQVIVVDDASTDESINRISNYTWVEPIYLRNNSGYGFALKTGFAQANGDFICFLDLDDTYDVWDIKKLILTLNREQVDFVFGNRMHAIQKMPLVRIVGNSFFTRIVQLLFFKSVADVCSGLRIFRRKWAKDLIALPNNGLEYSLSLTLWALTNEISFCEVPIRYNSRVGSSKLKVFSDGCTFLRTILQNVF